MPALSIDLVLHAPLGELGAATAPFAVLDGPRLADIGNFPQFIAVSSTTVAAEMQPGAFVLVMEAEAMRILDGGAVSGLPAHERVIGHDVLWEDWGAPVRVLHGSLTQAPEVLIDASPGDVQGFDTDGTRLAWQQAYDPLPTGGYSRVELWSAPATADPAALAPALVRSLAEFDPQAISGGGWYVTYDGNPFCVGGFTRCLQVTSLADGTQRQWVPSRLAIPQPPTYVSASEILVDATALPADTEALVRVDPTMLPSIP